MQAPAEPPAVWTPRHNPWLIATVVAMAAFMEVLDTSIANVSLPHMAGDLSAGTSESVWVLTSYLVSNAIVLPMTGWLVGVFGRKRFFLACIAVFTLSSLVCGMAANLGLLLLARVVQGIGGGGLQPVAQSILADSFPREKRGIAFAVFTLTVIFAPAIGPTLGGWITDNYSWRWIFLINLPVGVAAFALVNHLVEDPPFLKRLRGIRVDYIGFALLALGVGALQIMLDKGQEDDWFGSHFIVALAVIAVISLITLVIWDWSHKAPIIDFRLFKNRTFAATCLIMFFVGVVLFSGVVLMPQFLQSLMGYSAQSAGMVLSLGAIGMFFTTPMVGRLAAKVPAPYLMAIGWLATAAALYVASRTIDLSISFEHAAWLRAAQVLPLSLIFIPANVAAYASVPAEKSNAVAGMVNFMRNIGSSVGTSVMTAMLAQRAQIHQAALVAQVTPDNLDVQRTVATLATQLGHAGVSSADAQHLAYARVYGTLQQQASAMAYVDAYWLLAVGAVLMFVLTLLLRKGDVPVQPAATD
jgi:MFS transporter, DHA2 family, multidrug resistance protein